MRRSRLDHRRGGGPGLGPAIRGDEEARQIERHPRPFAGLGLDDGVAAGLAGEAEDLGEAEPGALAHRLGGEEGLEHPVEILGRDAGAVVLDADPDIVAAGQIVGLAVRERDIVDLDQQVAARRPSRRGR